MQDNYTLRDLLNARLHLGHKTNKWNPKMAPFRCHRKRQNPLNSLCLSPKRHPKGAVFSPES